MQRFFYASSRLRLQRRQADATRTSSPSRKKTPTPPCPKTATAGKSFSASACAAISARISASQTRVARYHNVYGPHGTCDGGREKAPAAICRKVIEAKLSGKHEIEIWGDGHQTRSFMYIDDCLKGTQDILAQRHPRADQPRQQRTGHHQPARRHRRRNRRRQAQAELQPQRAQRRQRPQQRQHPDQKAHGVGAQHPAARRHGKDLSLDLRPDEGPRFQPRRQAGPGRRITDFSPRSREENTKGENFTISRPCCSLLVNIWALQTTTTLLEDLFCRLRSRYTPNAGNFILDGNIGSDEEWNSAPLKILFVTKECNDPLGLAPQLSCIAGRAAHGPASPSQ